ncbi:MAG: valine--tRNA ligase [Candidatus Adiutrix sp.]|jgi:valyl-tRNA synthetase|nr:valine--tRNA ligase [Candidatus Adiutrix sp.]
MDMGKNFDHGEAERRIYEWWERSGFFRADPEKPGEPFVIVIPPPNVTGNLHMGHALDETLQDILIRYHRMRGDNTLWLPGTDHAGIATQNVVETALAAEGLTRQALGRAGFIERVWQWKEKYGSNIVRQLRRLGASCDFSRERFTMDEGLSRAVREVFVSLHEEGLIYRALHLINWCPRCLTALADLEVEHEERRGALYYLGYRFADGEGALTVATTRPETIFGDMAVAVHPEDERYRGHIGRRVLVPLINRPVPVIGDAYVDREFGTGVLKVTPAHDPNDFKLGQAHGLEAVRAIEEDGRLSPIAGRYAGQDRFEARRAMLPDLEAQGLLTRTEALNHAVGVCYRCRTVVEPSLSRQWFVRTASLAAEAARAVRDGRTAFVPKTWEKTYFAWLDNIRDWCISRQLWWGHQIPAWHCAECGGLTVTREDPAACAHCRSGRIERDPDVLDTWFSSALWPFSTLGWPDKTRDLARYYPTSVLVTGFDIIFFWVARMMMMGLHFQRRPPFGTVIIHALVKDAEGRKMSKSKGNVKDPLEIIDRYGADAFRFTLCALAGQGRDIRLSDERIAGYGRFVNKLWNASRLVLTNAGRARLGEAGPAGPADSLPDRWLASRLNRLTAQVRRHLDEFAYDHLAESLYHFVWDEFCDWYLELVKPVLHGPDEAAAEAARGRMLAALSVILRLLHPVMPFVTEELWSKIPGAAGPLMLAPFPAADEAGLDAEAEAGIGFLMDVTRAVRSVRADFRVPPASLLTPVILAGDQALTRVLAEYSPLVLKLTGSAAFEAAGPGQVKPREASLTAFPWGEVWVPLAGHIDMAEEARRLEKEAAGLARDLEAARAKLANPEYLGKAPEDIVEDMRRREADLAARRGAVERSLALLKGML